MSRSNLPPEIKRPPGASNLKVHHPPSIEVIRLPSLRFHFNSTTAPGGTVLHDETQAAEMEEGCMEKMEEGSMEAPRGCVCCCVDESSVSYPVCLRICYDLW